MSVFLHGFHCKVSFLNNEENIKKNLFVNGNDLVYVSQTIQIYQSLYPYSSNANDESPSISALTNSIKNYLPKAPALALHSLNIDSPQALYEILCQREAIRNLSPDLNISLAIDIIKSTLSISPLNSNLDIKYILLHKKNAQQRAIYTIASNGDILSSDIIEEKIASTILIQKNLSQAACIVFIIINLEKYLYQHGAIGYRIAMMKSGEKVIDLWLSCLAHNLVGCPCGGFSESILLPYGIDGYSNTVGIAFAFGEEVL
ncbi:nitroreductase family protein [Entomobacter blattae]|uniref:Nitroreductase domain-containing protein n=1 Tax=Entomobacter blattae TaxID=2762277 RepID=A0A7H1NSP6_9PROT|nr:hypothetical protein [Entomobacter blattae]QNT78806.1 hypothetical protein JGUZn3_15830 [Entomobacter blattae]